MNIMAKIVIELTITSAGSHFISSVQEVNTTTIGGLSFIAGFGYYPQELFKIYFNAATNSSTELQSKAKSASLSICSRSVNVRTPSLISCNGGLKRLVSIRMIDSALPSDTPPEEISPQLP